MVGCRYSLEWILAAVNERGNRFSLTVVGLAWVVSKDLRGPCTGNSFGFAFKSAAFRPTGVTVFVREVENGTERFSSIVVDDVGDGDVREGICTFIDLVRYAR